MAKPEYVVRPIDRNKARRMCADHPHAGTLPNSSKYYMELTINGHSAGLAVWGWGIVPKATPKYLFADNVCGVKDYLELCRFFVYDWCPTNSASKFLAMTHRIIKKHAPHVKLLYTYAAGFQGMIGHIYKAANYDYIGSKQTTAFVYIPDKGLIHAIAIWHRWKITWRHDYKILRKLKPILGECYFWTGLNFRYIYWLCDKKEKVRLLQHARFKILSYPTLNDLKIWMVDIDGRKEKVTPEFAKTVPIVKLSTKRKRTPDGGASVPTDAGGSIPTRSLQEMNVI